MYLIFGEFVNRVFKGILLILYLLVSAILQGQSKRLSGKIYAEETREPLAFANFFFQGTEKGFYSDFEGNFVWIGETFPSDTLRVEYMGYITRYIKLNNQSSGAMEVEMLRNVIQTEEVVIRLKTNPALKWIALAQENRNRNNPDKLEHYQCETFTKNTIAVNNISDKLRKGKFWQEIGPLFDTISYLNGNKEKSILPVFISEVISDYYFNKNPYLTKEYIRASRIKGIGVQDGTFISQVLGSTFVNYNFYMNTLVVIDKGIVSPIAESAMNTYDYKLLHVDKTGPRRVFQIYCAPKIEKDLAFKGFIWVEDTTGALLKLSLELNSSSNINYIEKLRITQEYTPTDNGSYFCVNTRAVIDAAEVSTQAAGVVATSVVTAKNIVTNIKHSPKFFESRVTMDKDALNRPDSFWKQNRHLPNTATDDRIAAKIDTLVNLPRISTYVDVVNFLVDGYKNFGKIDFGPYYSLVSFNQLEGPRLRLGFRTTPTYSKNWIVEGFSAYGFWDKQWKYSLKMERILNRKRWTKLGAVYRRDVEQIGISDNEDYSTGLFTAFNLLGSNNLNMNRDARIMFGTDLRNGLRLSMSFGNRAYLFQKVGNFNFAWYPYFPDTTAYANEFYNTTTQISLRYSPKYYYLQNDNRRVTFTGIGPEYYGTWIQGYKNVFGSQFNYTRLVAGLNYNKVWGAMGRTAFNVEASRVFGNLPYPLLTVYIGNQSFVYNSGAYNQMRIFEFITDRSISASAEHHLNGLFFNRIPLLNKLKWREVLGSKAIYGGLDRKNFNIIPQNTEEGPVSQFKSFTDLPYLECSLGIENIFKILRLDAIWRLTYREADNVRNFGVKVSVGLAF
ncbi:MAG: hypothetical protein RIT07_1415 [Bacteroidota bacterium]